MQDLYWKIFSQTGNVETYLLLKELEINPKETIAVNETEQSDLSSVYKQDY